MLIGDVGYQTVEEINIGAARANYGWPNAEGPSSNPSYTDPAFSYPLPPTRPLSWAGSSITGRSSRAATRSYFYADYAQHWIKRLTFDANGNVATPSTSSPPMDRSMGPSVTLST